MTKYLTILFALSSTLAFGQAFKDRDTLGFTFAKQFLTRYPSIYDSTRFFYNNPRHKHFCLLPDSLTAMNVAMPILIKLYGNEQVEGWRPFEVYFISNYWFISGTKKKSPQPKGVILTGGDPFIMVIDAFTSKVLYLMAGE